MSIVITTSDIEYVALFCASGESPLWKVREELARFDSDSPELTELCQRAVQSLLRSGLVLLYEDGYARYPIGYGRAEEFIACDSAWQIPANNDDDRDVYLVLTDAGARAFRKYPGLSRNRQHDLIELLLYGPYGNYPYGLVERICRWASRERHPLLRNYRPANIDELCGKAGLVLGKFTAGCLKRVCRRPGD
jgi:hypothetical protein